MSDWALRSTDRNRWRSALGHLVFINEMAKFVKMFTYSTLALASCFTIYDSTLGEKRIKTFAINKGNNTLNFPVIRSKLVALTSRFESNIVTGWFSGFRNALAWRRTKAQMRIALLDAFESMMVKRAGKMPASNALASYFVESDTKSARKFYRTISLWLHDNLGRGVKTFSTPRERNARDKLLAQISALSVNERIGFSLKDYDFHSSKSDTHSGSDPDEPFMTAHESIARRRKPAVHGLHISEKKKVGENREESVRDAVNALDDRLAKERKDFLKASVETVAESGLDDIDITDKRTEPKKVFSEPDNSDVATQDRLPSKYEGLFSALKSDVEAPPKPPPVPAHKVFTAPPPPPPGPPKPPVTKAGLGSDVEIVGGSMPPPPPSGPSMPPPPPVATPNLTLERIAAANAARVGTRKSRFQQRQEALEEERRLEEEKEKAALDAKVEATYDLSKLGPGADLNDRLNALHSLINKKVNWADDVEAAIGNMEIDPGVATNSINGEVKRYEEKAVILKRDMLFLSPFVQSPTPRSYYFGLELEDIGGFINILSSSMESWRGIFKLEGKGLNLLRTMDEGFVIQPDLAVHILYPSWRIWRAFVAATGGKTPLRRYAPIYLPKKEDKKDLVEQIWTFMGFLNINTGYLWVGDRRRDDKGKYINEPLIFDKHPGFKQSAPIQEKLLGIVGIFVPGSIITPVGR